MNNADLHALTHLQTSEIRVSFRLICIFIVQTYSF